MIGNGTNIIVIVSVIKYPLGIASLVTIDNNNFLFHCKFSFDVDSCISKLIYMDISTHVRTTATHL